jgi:hypothetical protein
LFGALVLAFGLGKFKGLGSVSGTGMARFALVILCEETFAIGVVG